MGRKSTKSLMMHLTKYLRQKSKAEYAFEFQHLYSDDVPAFSLTWLALIQPLRNSLIQLCFFSSLPPLSPISPATVICIRKKLSFWLLLTSMSYYPVENGSQNNKNRHLSLANHVKRLPLITCTVVKRSFSMTLTKARPSTHFARFLHYRCCLYRRAPSPWGAPDRNRPPLTISCSDKQQCTFADSVLAFKTCLLVYSPTFRWEVTAGLLFIQR